MYESGMHPFLWCFPERRRHRHDEKEEKAREKENRGNRRLRETPEGPQKIRHHLSHTSGKNNPMRIETGGNSRRNLSDAERDPSYGKRASLQAAVNGGCPQPGARETGSTLKNYEYLCCPCLLGLFGLFPSRNVFGDGKKTPLMFSAGTVSGERQTRPRFFLSPWPPLSFSCRRAGPG